MAPRSLPHGSRVLFLGFAASERRLLAARVTAIGAQVALGPGSPGITHIVTPKGKRAPDGSRERDLLDKAILSSSGSSPAVEVRSERWLMKATRKSEKVLATAKKLQDLEEKQDEPLFDWITPSSEKEAQTSKELAVTSKQKGRNGNRNTSALVKYVPPGSSEVQSVAQTARYNVRRSPTVVLAVPPAGPVRGSFFVAVFGMNFAPSTGLHLRFGDRVAAASVEWHATTCVLARVELGNDVRGAALPGEVMLSASNDGGQTFGAPTRFRFFDPLFEGVNGSGSKGTSETGIDSDFAVQSQLAHLRRSMSELESGLANARCLEDDLRARAGSRGSARQLGHAKKKPAHAPINHGAGTHRGRRVQIISPPSSGAEDQAEEEKEAEDDALSESDNSESDAESSAASDLEEESDSGAPNARNDSRDIAGGEPKLLASTGGSVGIDERRRELSSLLEQLDRSEVPRLLRHQSPVEQKGRDIRLFISSPFRDMQRERDMLVKRVIPRIRAMCAERDVTFSYVDFRWGVTKDASMSATSMLLCLREIARCNLFVGLWGERYGWALTEKSRRQPTPDDQLLKRTFDTAAAEFPFVNSWRDRSVSEVEMRTVLEHVLDGSKSSAGSDDTNTGCAKSAAWYLRDPYFYESLPEDERSKFEPESDFAHQKLTSFKREIISAKEFPVRNFRHAESLEEQVMGDLVQYVENSYPSGSELSPVEAERFRHAAFSKMHRRSYSQVAANHATLDRYAAGGVASAQVSKALVVSGDSGSGKSALLANWAFAYAQHHPEDVVVTQFVGCTAQSTNYARLLRQVMAELLLELSDHKTSLPSETASSAEIADEFPRFLDKILARHDSTSGSSHGRVCRKIILVLDGLDSLDSRENARELLWLPIEFAERVRVVASATNATDVFKRLKRRGCNVFTVPGLDQAVRMQLLRHVLSENAKKLSDAQESKIAAAAQTANPRYLRTLLDEMSVDGEFDTLDEQILSYLQAQNCAELYAIALQRVNAEYDSTGRGAVTKLLRLLWSARHGLHLSTELDLLLSEAGIEENERTTALAGLQDYLFVGAGGLVQLGNRDIRAAVEKLTISGDSDAAELHLRLANFFALVEDEHRKVEQWPWHLWKAQAWEKLRACLSDLSVFCALFTPSSKYDLISYWRELESHNPQWRVEDSYQVALGFTEQFPSGELVADVFYRVGALLEEMARFEGAGKVYLQAKHFYELASQSLDVAKVDYAAARVLQAQARYKESEVLLRKALEIYEREKGTECAEVSHVVNRMGALFVDTGRLSEAEAAFNRALDIREQIYGANSTRVAQTYKHLMNFHETAGQMDQAALVGEKALKMASDLLGTEDVQVSGIALRLGRVYVALKRYDEAKQMFKLAKRITLTRFGPAHPINADVLYEMACFYFQKPEDLVGGAENEDASYVIDKAVEILERALAIKEEALGPHHPDVARILTRLGSVAMERVELDKSQNYLQRALRIREKTLGPEHSRVAQTLRHLLTLYEMQEKYQEAVQTARRCLRVTNAISGADSTRAANVLVRLGQLLVFVEGTTSSEARKCFDRAIANFERKGGKDCKEATEVHSLIAELTRSEEEDEQAEERQAAELKAMQALDYGIDVSEIVNTSRAAVAQAKAQEEYGSYEQFDDGLDQLLQQQVQISPSANAFMTSGEGGFAEPPAPPPPPPMMAGPPAPPPPPGGLPSGTTIGAGSRAAPLITGQGALLEEIQARAEKPAALRKAKVVSRKADRGAWFKQNYAYGAMPQMQEAGAAVAQKMNKMHRARK